MVMVLVVLSCLSLVACEEKPKEISPQFRPSMATTSTATRPIESRPPMAPQRPVDPERHKGSKAAVVELRPGKSICRECEMRKAELLRRSKDRSKRPSKHRPKSPLIRPNLPEESQ